MGQFSKLEVFSIVGSPGVSSPYQAGVEREKKSFEASAKIIRSQGLNIDKRTWWLVRDNLRGQAYTMKANMRALNEVQSAAGKVTATKAYEKFWKEIDQLDLACRTKE